MAKSGTNPQFLKAEKKVQYNARFTQRLINKLNAYAELTGNTTTNIVNNVLDDFLSDKVVLNDYLDNVGGVAVKIPYAVYQKHNLTVDGDDYGENLLNYNNTDNYVYYIVDEVHSETYFAELFEVKKIPNNCDIISGDSYVANKKSLLFNKNAIHSGIELFIYNIAESLFADAKLVDKFDSFDNALYCLYFEVAPDDSVAIYLIDYMKAINLLSASGNDKYKNLIIAAATELKQLNKIADDYFYEITERKSNLKYNSEIDYAENYEYDVEMVEKEVYEKYLKILKSALSGVADKYNSNNIIPFGSDIFSRLAVEEVEVEPKYFDEIIADKVDKCVSLKIDDIIKRLDTLENSSDNAAANQKKK